MEGVLVHSSKAGVHLSAPYIKWILSKGYSECRRGPHGLHGNSADASIFFPRIS